MDDQTGQPGQDLAGLETFVDMSKFQEWETTYTIDFGLKDPIFGCSQMPRDCGFELETESFLLRKLQGVGDPDLAC